MQGNFDEAKALRQMAEIAEVPVDVQLRAGDVLALIAGIQLAWRHPRWDGPTKQLVEVIARNWQDMVAGRGSDMWWALEAGWNPDLDTSRASVPQGGNQLSVTSEQSASETAKRPITGSGQCPGRNLEMGRGNVKVIGGMTKAIVATVNRWVSQHGPVEFIDMFMALHNAHCAVVFDLEEKTEDSKGRLRKMALDTMQERFEREPNRGTTPGNDETKG